MASNFLNSVFQPAQQSGLDRFDLEAAQEGRSLRTFRFEHAMARPCSKRQAKRMLRGAEGAKQRNGLLTVPRQ